MTQKFENLTTTWAVALIACILMHCAAHADEPRLWTSSSGKQVVAEMVSATDDRVELRAKGRTESFWVPIEQLSAGDQDYVRRIREQNKSTPDTSSPSDAQAGDSRKLNQRMNRLATELKLPVADGLPVCWFSDSSRYGNGLYSKAWRRLSDRVVFSIEPDFLALRWLDNDWGVEYSKARKRKFASLPRDQQTGLKHLRTRTPMFIMHHFDEATAGRYINFRTDRRGERSLDKVPWKGGSPQERFNTAERFFQEQAVAFDKLRIDFPVRFKVAYPVTVSSYDRDQGCYKFSHASETNLAKGLPFPGTMSDLGRKRCFRLPVLPFPQPDRWTVNAAEGARFMRPDPRRSDGSSSLFLTHIIEINRASISQTDRKSSLPLISTVKTSRLYADTQLSQLLHTYAVPAAVIPAQQVALTEKEVPDQQLRTFNATDIAALMLTVEGAPFGDEGWSLVWRNQASIDFQKQQGTIKSFSPEVANLKHTDSSTRQIRPFFFPFVNAQVPSFYDPPTDIERKQLAAYLKTRGKQIKSLIVRARFGVDGVGPVLVLGDDKTHLIQSTAGDNLPREYSDLRRILNQSWNEVGGLPRLPDRQNQQIECVMGSSIAADKIVWQLSETLRDEIKKTPRDFLAEITYALESPRFAKSQHGVPVFAIEVVPSKLDVYRRSKKETQDSNLPWYERLETAASIKIADSMIPADGEGANVLPGPVDLTPSGLFLFAAAKVDHFAEDYADQLLTHRHRAESNSRSKRTRKDDPGISRIGTFFLTNQSLPKTPEERGAIRERFSLWLKSNGKRLPNSFRYLERSFKFEMDPTNHSLSPVRFNAAISTTAVSGLRRIKPNYRRRTDRLICLTKEEFDEKTKTDALDASDYYIWDYESYQALLKIPPAELELSTFALPDLGGKKFERTNDLNHQVTSNGIPLKKNAAGVPLHTYLKLDSELWLPEDAAMNAGDHELAVAIEFEVRSISRQHSPPKHAYVNATRRLLGAEEVDNDLPIDQGDYLIIDVGVTSAQIVDYRTEEVQVELMVKPYRAMPAVKPLARPAPDNGSGASTLLRDAGRPVQMLENASEAEKSRESKLSSDQSDGRPIVNLQALALGEQGYSHDEINWETGKLLPGAKEDFELRMSQTKEQKKESIRKGNVLLQEGYDYHDIDWLRGIPKTGASKPKAN